MFRTALITLSLLVSGSTLFAHCQVPCGIYGDQLRFEQLLEDTKTIAKAQVLINELADADHTGQNVNQMVRWVTTKEEHATNIQKTIAAYFMAQRLKADGEDYEKKLVAAHKVMVAAMKCKQSTDLETSDALKAAIYDFYRAYEGKEPVFEKEDHKH